MQYSGPLQRGRPIRICATGPTGVRTSATICREVDSVGHYRLDSLSLTKVFVSINCDTQRLWGAERLASDSIQLNDTTPLRRDWRVSTARCDPRPLRRITGEFRGYYTVGFENSEFRPCWSDAWFLPADSLVVIPIDLRMAWVTWPKRASGAMKWPDVPRDQFGYRRYFVRWRGTVVGPGIYGHMGIAPFEFTVDTVLDVRRPAERDCY